MNNYKGIYRKLIKACIILLVFCVVVFLGLWVFEEITLNENRSLTLNILDYWEFKDKGEEIPPELRFITESNLNSILDVISKTNKIVIVLEDLKSILLGGIIITAILAVIFYVYNK